MKNPVSITRTLIAVIVVISLIYLTLGLMYKPIISGDALNGFISLHNYLNGTGWNKVLGFGTDFHVNESELTWWAPGQYQIPYLVSRLLHVDIGNAITILLFVCTLGGCYFYYIIFRRSRLSSNTILIALCTILLQRFFNINFIQYSSSDLFLFFYVPFYIFLYQYATSSPSWVAFKLIALLGVNLCGLYIKNGFMLFALAFNAYLFIQHLLAPYFKKQLALLKTLWLVPFVAAAALHYYFFLRLGNTPATGWGLETNISALLQGAFAAITGSSLSAFSIFGIWGNFNRSVTAYGIYLDGLIVIVLAILALSIFNYRAAIKDMLKRDRMLATATTVGIAFALFWIGFVIRKSAVANEDRLFMPSAILLLPYLIEYSKHKVITKFFVRGLLCISVSYGIMSLVYRIKSYSTNLSSISRNPHLKGFKVFAPTENDVLELKHLSDSLSHGFANSYLVTPNANLLFLLNVENKFIIGDAPNSAINVKQAHRYPTPVIIFLIDKKGTSLNSRTFKTLFSTQHYALYTLAR